jgi:hypothetical protein
MLMPASPVHRFDLNHYRLCGHRAIGFTTYLLPLVLKKLSRTCAKHILYHMSNIPLDPVLTSTQELVHKCDCTLCTHVHASHNHNDNVKIS